MNCWLGSAGDLIAEEALGDSKDGRSDVELFKDAALESTGDVGVWRYVGSEPCTLGTFPSTHWRTKTAPGFTLFQSSRTDVNANALKILLKGFYLNLYECLTPKLFIAKCSLFHSPN